MARVFVRASNEYITGGSIAIPATGTTSIWVKTSNTSDQLTPWEFGDASAQDYPGFQKYFVDNYIYAGFAHDGNSRITINDGGNTIFVNGVWANYVFNWSVAGGQNLYKNASAIGSSSPYTHAAHSFGFRLGAYTINNTGGFSGALADFAMWNVVLTAGEMSALANGVRPNRIRPPMVWQPLDGFQSPEPDLSGNANNGTLTGTAYAPGPPVTMFTPRWPVNDVFEGVAGPTFNPAWAAQSNLPVIGAGTF